MTFFLNNAVIKILAHKSLVSLFLYDKIPEPKAMKTLKTTDILIYYESAF